MFAYGSDSSVYEFFYHEAYGVNKDSNVLCAQNNNYKINTDKQLNETKKDELNQYRQFVKHNSRGLQQ